MSTHDLHMLKRSIIPNYYLYKHVILIAFEWGGWNSELLSVFLKGNDDDFEEKYSNEVVSLHVFSEFYFQTCD